MPDNQPEPNYQDILDEYAANQNPAPEAKIPDIDTEPLTSLPPTPPSPEAIDGPPPQIELAPETPTLVPSKENNFFKYLFFFSLTVLIVVLISTVISFLNTQKSPNNSSTNPTSTPPTESPSSFCEINGQSYAVGQSFPASDGCNSCSCDSNLQISCTTIACEPTTVKPTTTSSDLKSQVENWSSYTKSPTKLSWDKCDDEPNISSEIKQAISSIFPYGKQLNGANLLYTLKLNFTAEDIGKFVMCQAGGYHPLKVIGDKILWVSACSTGIAPDNTECETTLIKIRELYGYARL